MKKNNKTIIFSLGGSLIVPNKIDISFLKKFRTFVLYLLNKGYKIVIVAGGGGISREYNNAVKKIIKTKKADLDWLGISATAINAELIRITLSNYAYHTVVHNPNTKIKTNKRIIVACGWKPGCSSDLDSVLWAKNLNTKIIINLTDIDFVYTKDPDKYVDAKPIKQILWKDFLKIIGTKWCPRKSAPFGPIASKLAKKMNISVVILNGKKIKNLQNYINNKKFKGTIIY